MKLNLAGSIPDAQHVPGLIELLTRTLTVDLFVPPQRERIRLEVIALLKQDSTLTHRQIAERILEKPTATAVQKALALEKKQKELELESPYVVVLEPPDDYPKLRRHKNPKYRFEPLDRYERPAI